MTPEQVQLFNDMAGRILAIIANTETVEWTGAPSHGERNVLHDKLEEILAAAKTGGMSPDAVAGLTADLTAALVPATAAAAKAGINGATIRTTP